MMQNLGNRRSVQKCAQNAGSNVLKQARRGPLTVAHHLSCNCLFPESVCPFQHSDFIASRSFFFFTKCTFSKIISILLTILYHLEFWLKIIPINFASVACSVALQIRPFSPWCYFPSIFSLLVFFHFFFIMMFLRPSVVFPCWVGRIHHNGFSIVLKENDLKADELNWKEYATYKLPIKSN